PAAERFLKLWGVFDDPPIEGGMIDCHTPLAHHLLQLPIRNRIRYIPPYSPQDNFPLELTALEVDHAAAPPPHAQARSIAEHPSSAKLRQSRGFSATHGRESLFVLPL